MISTSVKILIAVTIPILRKCFLPLKVNNLLVEGNALELRIEEKRSVDLETLKGLDSVRCVNFMIGLGVLYTCLPFTNIGCVLGFPQEKYLMVQTAPNDTSHNSV